jgi:glycosyltransferase involved in cell wall biosynthesis
LQLLSRQANILFFSSFKNLGWGGQESLFLLASRLSRSLFRAVVVVPQRGSLADKLGEFSIDSVPLDLPPVRPANIGRIIRALWKLWSVTEQYHIDLLHSDGPRNTLYAGLIARLKRRPLVWHVRSFESDPYDRMLCWVSSKVILVADALAERFPAKAQKAKCVTIYNGVDLQRFVPASDPRTGPATPMFEEPCLVVCHTGRVEPQKGQKKLIEACGRLRYRVPQLRIVFAGAITDEDYLQECYQYASRLGVRERIRFIGQQADVRGLLHASDIFVLPSIRGEAFSRSMLEAMASGKPVIATACGGAAEALVDGHSGFIVPSEDSGALAEKIALLATHSELRNGMGQAARNRAEALFGIETNVERTMEIYQELLRCR